MVTCYVCTGCDITLWLHIYHKQQDKKQQGNTGVVSQRCIGELTTLPTL